MIKLDKVTHQNYTLILDGNGIEEQMLIVLSTGQSGGMAVRLVYSSIDNGANVPATKTRVFNKLGTLTFTKTAEKVFEYLTEEVAWWISRGLPGNTEPSIKQANAAIKKFLMV